MKLSVVLASVLGLSAAACAGRPAAPARGAAIEAAPTTDATPTTGRPTTGATAISGAAEDAREEPKTDASGPIPSSCAAEGTVKDAMLCTPDRAYAKKLCRGVYPEAALGLARARRSRACTSRATSRRGTPRAAARIARSSLSTRRSSSSRRTAPPR